MNNTSLIPKIDAFSSFSESSPEPEEKSLTQEPASVQRQKSGRKLIYATAEERRRRNREAQTGYRQRRTKLIKQLETTIEQHEEDLRSLRQSYRSRATECSMLRYKNSLLERILLEKKIDMRAELKSKTEEDLIKRQSIKVRRSTSGSESGLQTQSSQAPLTNSPRLQSRLPSQNQFPTLTKAPLDLGKDGVILPYVDLKAQQQQQLPSAHDLSIPATRLSMQTMTPSTASRNSKLDSTTTARLNLCSSSFQTHEEQLRRLSYPSPPLFLIELWSSKIDSVSTEHEYDTYADVLDDENPSDYDVGPVLSTTYLAILSYAPPR